jgi:helix-turn-helix protein
MVRRWRSMKGHSSQPRSLTAAQRGQIVQRVIVDGWTIADAAAAARLSERIVAAWVNDFRQHGMASLRQRPGKIVAAGYLRHRFARYLRLVFRGAGLGVRWLFAIERPAPPSSIRQSRDDRRGGS